MAVVNPVTENRQQLRPVDTTPLRAAEFDTGQTVGRAAAQFGEQGMSFAEQQQRHEIAFSEAAARDADNQATIERQRLYHEGDAAFFNQRGRNALNAIEPLNVERQRIDREALTRLQGDELAQDIYRRVAAHREAADNERIYRHVATERTTYENAVDADALSVTLDTAVSAADNPDEIMRNIATARIIVERNAVRQGIAVPGSPEMEARQRRAAGAVVSAVANAIERRSPAEAEAFIRTMRNVVDAETYTRLLDAVEEPAAAEHADENVAEDIVYTDGAAAAPDGASAARASGAAGAVGAALSAGGLPAPVVAGFLGNIHHESGFRSGPSGDGGTAHGIVQWRAERVANFQRIIGVHPSQATDAQAARFILWEMEHPEQAFVRQRGLSPSQQRDRILAARTPEEAASLIDQFYERSDGRSRGARQQAAREYAGVASAHTIDLEATVARINGRTDLTYPERQARIAAASRRAGLERQTVAAEEDRVRDQGSVEMNRLGDNYTNYDQLPLTVRAQLSRFPQIERQFRAIAQTNREEAARRAEAGPPRYSQQFMDLLEASQGGEQDRALFMRQDLRSPTLNIPNTERVELMRIQGSYRRSGEDDAQHVATREAVNVDRVRTYVARVAVEGGFQPPARTRMTADQRQNFLLLTQRVVDRARAEQTHLHRQLTDEELQAIVASEVRPVTVVTQGTFGERREPVPNYRARPIAEAAPNRYLRTEVAVPEGVPVRQAQAIVEAYRRENAGARPTDAMILEIYHRRQGIR